MPNLLGLAGATHTSIPCTWPCQHRCCWQCCSPPTMLSHSVCPIPPLIIMRHNAVSRPSHMTCEESFTVGKEELLKHLLKILFYFALCSPEQMMNFHLTMAAENALKLAVFSDWFVRFSIQRVHYDHNWQQFNNNKKIKIELQPYKRISSVIVLKGKAEKGKEKPARPLITNLVISPLEREAKKLHLNIIYFSSIWKFSCLLPLLCMPFIGSQCLSYLNKCRHNTSAWGPTQWYTHTEELGGAENAMRHCPYKQKRTSP